MPSRITHHGLLALIFLVLSLGFSKALAGSPGPEPLFSNLTSPGWFSSPAISPDGRILAFLSTAPDLVSDDQNLLADVFVLDRQTGDLQLASISSAGYQANGWSYRISLSANGRFLAYSSLANNLVSGDDNGLADIFVHDLLTGETTLVSRATGGELSNGWSDWPAISGDGRYVVFSSTGDNLVYGDTNRAVDVFVHDRLTNETSRVSVSSSGEEGEYGSGWATAISSDGRWIAFASDAGNLTVGDTNGQRDVFLHNRVTGATKRAPVPWHGSSDYLGSEWPALSSRGSYLAFTATRRSSPGLAVQREAALLVYHPESGELQELSRFSYDSPADNEFMHPVFSGETLAFIGAGPSEGGGNMQQISRVNLSTGELVQYNTSQDLEAGMVVLPDRPAIAANARVLVFTGQKTATDKAEPGQPEIYLLNSDERPVSRFIVSGRVLDPSGNPLRSTDISLQPDLSTSTDRQGYFFISGVPAGDYRLVAAKEGYAFTPVEMMLKVEGDLKGIRLTARSIELLDEARKDLGMPYSFHRGCASELEGCGGPFHGFHAGYCTDLVLDALLWGVDFNLQFALERDALAHPDHFYRWRNARNAQDMWRYFHYTGQMLANDQSYQPGDILFFDWDGDAVIDHVSLVAEVDAGDQPKSMIDATGKIAYNPDGLAAELEWENFHARTIRGHGRWLGSYGAIHPATPADLQVLQIVLDTEYLNARLIDSNGHSLNVENNPSPGKIPGGATFQQPLGIVLSVISPRANGDYYLLELSSQVPASYNLQVQTQEGGFITDYLAYNQQVLAAGEVRFIGIQLLREREKLQVRVIDLD